MDNDKKMKALNSLLMYVVENNSYYRNLYRDINIPINRIEQLPLLLRSDIRANKDAIISALYDITKLKYDKTNGTTDGKPVDIYKTHGEWVNADMSLWRKRRSINRAASRRYAFYYYNGNDYSKTCKIFKSEDHLAIQFPMKKVHIDQFIYDLNLMKKENISWLIAPPSIIYTIASVAMKNNVDITFDIIESISEYLPSFYRVMFEDVFKCSVYVHYSCHEVWGMAYSDDKGNMEIMDNVIIEIQEDKRFKNGYGKCIVTNLMVKSMPFIRYELSDLLIQDGNYIKIFGFRYMESVYIKNIDIHCCFFANIFADFNKIELLPLENYQIIYNQYEIILILVNTDIKLNQEIKLFMETKIKEYYKLDINIRIINGARFYVDTYSGKMRGIIEEQRVNYDSTEFNYL
jgi:phenylacetate-coenzyme A ligase PaaK-like adenylate-forming protein